MKTSTQVASSCKTCRLGKLHHRFSLVQHRCDFEYWTLVKSRPCPLFTQRSTTATLCLGDVGGGQFTNCCLLEFPGALSMCMVSCTRLDRISTLYRELIVGIGASGTQGETARRLDITAMSLFAPCSGPSQSSALLNGGARIRNVQAMRCEQYVSPRRPWNAYVKTSTRVARLMQDM